MTDLYGLLIPQNEKFIKVAIELLDKSKWHTVSLDIVSKTLGQTIDFELVSRIMIIANLAEAFTVYVEFEDPSMRNCLSKLFNSKGGKVKLSELLAKMKDQFNFAPTPILVRTDVLELQFHKSGTNSKRFAIVIH
ncbi:MAG: hypothetical protein V1707_00795 [bacterium]